MDLDGRRVVVFGAGASGCAAARLCLARGAAVALWDDAPPERLSDAARQLADAGATLHGPRSDWTGGAVDLAVVSPGVPFDHPRVRALRDAGVETLGELELAARFLAAPIVAVTGTNGKSTVTELIGLLLRDAGRRVFVGGNLGVPLAAAVGAEWDAVVAEASSFQLETTQHFHPHVAVFLNLTADHLDRHRDMAAYAAAKARVFANQGRSDALVANADDPAVWDLARTAPAVLLPYSLRRTLGAGAWVEGDDAVFVLPGRDGVRVPRRTLRLPGPHNLGNALAACLAAAWLGLDPAACWESACRYGGLPHRLELFLEWRGVRFVDDSKATNVDAARQALEAAGPRVVWLGGGVDKGGSYAPLVAPLQRVAREAILVGESAGRIAAALGTALPLRVAADWPQAVRWAVSRAEPGDTVLLSPACSSFDHFTSYAQRGEVFQTLCREETRRRDRAH